MTSLLSRTKIVFRKIPTIFRESFCDLDRGLSVDGCCFDHRYELSDGQKREEIGTLRKVGDREIFGVIGSYTFRGSDGSIYVVDYTADENGYKAKVNSE